MGVVWGQTYLPSNSQVDNVGIDVRLTQLRNLLAGTRPPVVGNNAIGAVNNDNNYVDYSNGQGAERVPVFFSNGFAEPPNQPGTIEAPTAVGADTNGFPYYYVVRSTTPVPGRWGEAQSIPGTPFPNPAPDRHRHDGPARFVNVVVGP